MNINEALNLFKLKQGYTEPELKKRYRELLKKWHPDINNTEEAQQMTLKLNEAYALLCENTVQDVFVNSCDFVHTSFFDIKRQNIRSDIKNDLLQFKHKSFFDICLN